MEYTTAQIFNTLVDSKTTFTMVKEKKKKRTGHWRVISIMEKFKRECLNGNKTQEIATFITGILTSIWKCMEMV